MLPVVATFYLEAEISQYPATYITGSLPKLYHSHLNDLNQCVLISWEFTKHVAFYAKSPNVERLHSKYPNNADSTNQRQLMVSTSFHTSRSMRRNNPCRTRNGK